MRVSFKSIMLFALVLGTLLMTYQLTSMASQTEEWCEAKWVNDSAKLVSNQIANPNYDAMLTQWLKYEGSCGKTVTYITHLALIQMLQKNFDAAKTTLARADSNASDYRYLIDSTKVQLEIQEVLASNKVLTKADYSKFETVYLEIVKKYPNWLNGYGLLGGMQTELGKYKEAITNLEKAEKAENYDLYYTYRNLTISHAALNENEAALAAADKAHALNKKSSSDLQFMIAYANASTALGYLEDSQNVLKLLLTKDPELENNIEFVKAVENFKKALDKQK